MSQATTQADDGTKLKLNGDPSDVTELEARRVFENTDYSVTVNAQGHRDKARIAVYWKSDLDDVNGYHKASVINEVLDSPASVELHTTDDGRHAVTFTPR